MEGNTILISEKELQIFIQSLAENTCDFHPEGYKIQLNLLNKYLTEEHAIELMEEFFEYQDLPEKFQTRDFMCKCKNLFVLLGTPYKKDKVVISKIIDNGAIDLHYIDTELLKEDKTFRDEIIEIGFSDLKYSFSDIIYDHYRNDKEYILEKLKTYPKHAHKIVQSCSDEILKDKNFVKFLIKEYSSPEMTKYLKSRYSTYLIIEEEENKYKNLLHKLTIGKIFNLINYLLGKEIF